jgi:hypothetical protein
MSALDAETISYRQALRACYDPKTETFAEGSTSEERLRCLREIMTSVLDQAPYACKPKPRIGQQTEDPEFLKKQDIRFEPTAAHLAIVRAGVQFDLSVKEGRFQYRQGAGRTMTITDFLKQPGRFYIAVTYYGSTVYHELDGGIGKDGEEEDVLLHALTHADFPYFLKEFHHTGGSDEEQVFSSLKN